MQLPRHFACGIGIQAGVEECGRYAELLEGVHLILHQRDQRRHHDADAVAQQGRNLVAQRLAAAGGHQHQRIAPAGHMLDDGLLRAAKGGVAEGVAQYLLGGAGTHE